MSKRAIETILATSMETLFLTTMRYKAYEENSDLFSNKGSARYLAKQTYKNKLRKNKKGKRK